MPPVKTEFKILGRKYSMKELEGIAKITRGQKVSYISDSSIDEANIKK